MITFYKESKIFKIKISELVSAIRKTSDEGVTYSLVINGTEHSMPRAIFEDFYWSDSFNEREIGTLVEGIDENFNTIKKYIKEN